MMKRNLGSNWTSVCKRDWCVSEETKGIKHTFQGRKKTKRWKV